MGLKEAVKRMVPAGAFQLIRDVPWVIADWRTKPPVGAGPIPPLRLMFDGPRGYDIFQKAGQDILAFYKTTAGMRPTDVVLDIGCGIGRKTLPLLKYLTGAALYVGVDIDPRGIEWLQRNVTSQNQRFTFFQINIFNKFYNPKGTLLPDKIVFPFPDSSFDMVMLWSVFTHMYPADIAHYLKEIARVLKPGGTLTASWFLYNPEILELVRRGQTQLNFTHELENCRTVNPNIPEDAIAVSDSWLRGVLTDCGFTDQRIIYGNWSAPGNQYTQDIVIAKTSVNG